MSCKSKRKQKKYGQQRKTIFGAIKPQWQEQYVEDDEVKVRIGKVSNKRNLVERRRRRLRW